MSKVTPIHRPFIDVHDPKPWVHGTQHPVRIVLHDTESHDVAGTSDISGIFNFWHTQKNPDGTLAQYGVHFIVDEEGKTGQGGDPEQLQWHVGGANTGSVGIEQVGLASFTEKQWLARPDQLIKVAKLLAWMNKEYGIPLRVSTSFGVSTHAMQSAVHPESGGHSDPGKGYPLEHVMAIARDFKEAGGWPPDNKPNGGAVTPPKPKPPVAKRIYSIAFTDKHGHRAQTASFSPGLWMVSHPRIKRRGPVTITPAGKQKPK